jgi:hypothetical protein
MRPLRRQEVNVTIPFQDAAGEPLPNSAMP